MLYNQLRGEEVEKITKQSVRERKLIIRRGVVHGYQF